MPPLAAIRCIFCEYLVLDCHPIDHWWQVLAGVHSEKKKENKSQEYKCIGLDKQKNFSLNL